MHSGDATYPRFTILDEAVDDGTVHSPRQLPFRGVGWVLRWSAAIAVLLWSLVQLADFGFRLAAERTLLRAAQAGALEAMLPRATRQSVSGAVVRRLGSFGVHPGDLKVYLSQNGAPAVGSIRLQPGDRLSVTLVLSGKTALPRWMRKLTFWRSDRMLEARAERRLPGRELPKADRRLPST
jgi:hypothetical protein